MIGLDSQVEEIFVYSLNDGRPDITFRSGELRKFLLRSGAPTEHFHFPKDETFDSMVNRHGLELDRLDSMTETEAGEPVIVILFEGHHVLVDGGHRRAFWAKRGVHTLRGWLVPEHLWAYFVVANRPPFSRVGSACLPHRSKA